MRPTTVICWKWAPPTGYRSTFTADAVNVLRSMVARHYPVPHRFVCVTDEADGIDPRVEVVPAWNDFADVPSPHGGRNPSCYRRLRLFDPAIGTVFGPRFVSLDLDVVVTGDLTPLWERDDDLVLWGDTNPQPGSHYNGSMILMTAGARPDVWTAFNPQTSPMQSKSARCFGSDQGWISFQLGKGEAKWSRTDGVYSYRNDIAPHGHRLPGEARIVMFHGCHDPWDTYVQTHAPWVREHWR